MRIGSQKIYHLDYHWDWQEVGQGFVDLVLSDPPYGSQVRKYPSDEKPDFSYLAWIFNQHLSPTGAVALIHSPQLTTEIEIDFRKYFRPTFREYWHKPSAMSKIKDRPKPDIDVVTVFHRRGSSVDSHIFNWETIAEVKEPFVRRNRNLKNTTMTTPKREIDVNVDGKRYPSSLIRVANRPSMTKAEKAGITHPFQKSLAAVRRLVLLLSNPGDLVLDPYLGSGTTMIAAERTGRRGVGYEIDESNYLEAEARLTKEVYGVQPVGLTKD